MAERITYSINVQVAGGPRISESKTLEMEAYDKLHLVVPHEVSDAEVKIQPGGAGLAKFLVMTASSYEGLTYKINSSADDAEVIDLDGPQFFAGEGAVGLLYRPAQTSTSGAPPTELYFTSTSSEDIAVEILVARDATPATP